MTAINTTADRPAPKKQKINQFRRLLWHINRTDLGWVTKAALTTLQPGARARRVALLDQLPSKAEWSEASRKLDRDGYVDVSTLMDRGLAEAVATVAEIGRASCRERV